MSRTYLTSPPILHRDLGVKFARQNVDQLRTLKRRIKLQKQNHLSCKGGVWHHKRLSMYALLTQNFLCCTIWVMFCTGVGYININPNVMHI